MIELLSNCSHGSETATYLLVRDGQKKTIVKTASTPAGIEALKREKQGYDWYQERRYQSRDSLLCRVTDENGFFMRLEIEFIEGVPASYRKKMKENYAIMKQVIEHYCLVWPSLPNKLGPLHGDLSLGNIICGIDGIYIIDWEHFYLNGVPWGFDALYFLFETLWFAMRNKGKPSGEEINIVTECIRLLNHDNRMEPEIIRHPLSFMKRFIIDNGRLWGVFPTKIPVLSFTDRHVALIEDMVSVRLEAVL